MAKAKLFIQTSTPLSSRVLVRLRLLLHVEPLAVPSKVQDRHVWGQIDTTDSVSHDVHHNYVPLKESKIYFQTGKKDQARN